MSVLQLQDTQTLKYVITHVFCPLRLPGEDDYSVRKDHSLARSIAGAAELYLEHVEEANLLLWNRISLFLGNLSKITRSKDLDKSEVVSQIGAMKDGDIIVLPIRAQNAGVIFIKQKDTTIYESFELSPKAEDVMTTKGKLVCSYPGPAIEVPNSVFGDEDFRSELVNFLTHMNNDDLVSPPTYPETKKPPDATFKDSVHPHFITALLTGILRGVGLPANITRITKRIGDDVMLRLREKETKLPWRRSALWLLIRVSLQTTLHSSSLGNNTYKEFILFFLCNVAEEMACGELPSDLLQFMSTKISRRLRKLGSSAPDWLTQIALHACTSLRDEIENRWSHVQAAQHLSPPWIPSQLNLSQDINLSFSRVARYLCSSPTDSHSPASYTPFNPAHHHRGVLANFLSPSGAFFRISYRIEPHATLYDLEQAVEQDINAWVDSVTDSDSACESLELLASIYSSKALEMYANNPELWSVMLLTVVELWIALDRITVKEIPLLAEYSPEVPTTLLERLLLYKSASLKRLRCAHEYLSLRHSRSTRGSVFSSSITEMSFSVRFYQGALHLQRLKDQIEEKASQEVREKLAELRGKNVDYAKRIFTGRSVSDMSIRPHVWPLPAGQFEAEALVFELDCPVPFQMWRTATLHLLVDLCSSSSSSNTPRLQVRDVEYFGSELYVHRHPRSRIIFKDNRYFTKTPKGVHIPATPRQVCVKSALYLEMFDARTGTPVSRCLGHGDVGGHCTYELPESNPYYALQKYINSTSHTSNGVIANQADRHGNISIHEYMAFGHLRSGGSLQWLNILREIRSRSLNFSHLEVHFLLAQAVSQVGPFENLELKWHKEIQEPMFCHALLTELKGLLRDIESNWTQGVAMDTISFLVRRVLASNPDSTVSQEALGLLGTIRDTVFCWVRELFARISRNAGDRDCRRILWDAAAICRGTFDVDHILILDLLSSVENVEALFSSALIIHSYMPTNTALLSAHSRLLLGRDRRLSLTLEHTVSNKIGDDPMNDGINRAVRWIWPDFNPSSRWISTEGLNSPWFCGTITGADGLRPREVHINFVDGSLFIDGKPFRPSLLIERVVKHPLYKLIFGERMLEVTPSDLPGLDFSTKDLICEHRVYFSSMNDGSNLIIRAKRTRTYTVCDSDVIELIPPESLERDLPSVLINGHAHWLNLSTSIIEIRPLNKLWETSLDNWRIECTSSGHYVRRRSEFLVDMKSSSWNMISSLFRPFCSPQDLLISVTYLISDLTASPQLSILLPRHDISFYVDEDGDLRSRSIRDMVYDDDQSIGTFFGLVNRLVLRPKNKFKDVDSLEVTSRCVLILDGNVSYRMDGHHARVEITPSSHLERVTYQTYKVDTELGCLVGNGSLTSKLYCAYLHALTSGSTTDPLTGRSGIKEALSILRSAACWSGMTLVDRDAELLTLISSLYPMRTFDWYQAEVFTPKVDGHDLPANSQNYELYLVSKAIKEHYDKIQELNKDQLDITWAPGRFSEYDESDCYLSRSTGQATRAPYISVHSSGAEFDATYHPRHAKHDSGEHRACIAATRIYNRTATLSRDILGKIKLLALKISVASSGPSSLQYNRSWLSDLPSIWLKTYNLLRESNENKWSQMFFSLPSMVYGLDWPHDDVEKLVLVFVAIALHPQFRSEDPPPYDSYPKQTESRPSFHILRNHVTTSMRKHRDTPPQRVANYLIATTTARRLMRAWPCETPPPSSLRALNPDVYRVTRFKSWVQQYFSGCYCRLKLEEHLVRVCNILEDYLRSQTCTTRNVDVAPYSFQPLQHTHTRVQWWITVDQLFTRPAPLLCTDEKLKSHRLATIRSDSTNRSHAIYSSPLLQLINTVEPNAANPVQCQCVAALRSSAEFFESSLLYQEHSAKWLPAIEIVVEYYANRKDSYKNALRQVQQHLGPQNPNEHIFERSGQWPSITPYTLFRYLASNSPVKLSDGWKKVLITLGLLALELQRARRLLLLCLENHPEDFWKEVWNDGCDGWDAELQGNFLIRPIQADVASEMISPRSGNNTVIQLNMGEGKSSVIVPIVTAVLANGDQLVRVVVPKSLITQTRHLLVDRLGGLANRRIYYLPFSRTSKVNEKTIGTLHQIMLECMQERGILVFQPEHILALKLVSVERQLYQKRDDPASCRLLDLQRWLDSCSRDILDESDEILDVRSQLVFTIGQEQHVDGFPERWIITEQVLGLVSKHAFSLWELFPRGVEYKPGPAGSFSYFRILQKDAEEQLLSWIVKDVIGGHLPNMNFAHFYSHPGLDAIRSFISCQEMPPEEVQFLKDNLGKTSSWAGLLLLRGLLAMGILPFALRERRWRVNYGLFPTRTMLAVPYRAKDIPAQRAVFGHPDITILFTCLSYYYAGLDEEQLEHSFMILLDQHDPSLDYNLWVHACPDIPELLRTTGNINLESKEQWNVIYPLFSRNRETINFYLSRVVFPKEIKEFPSKLSGSGWHFSEKNGRPTVTGFSGTNDGQYLYPLGITQHDLDHQRGTNAKVLSYILQPENNRYVCMAREDGKQRTTYEFLRLLISQEPEIRVLLDVGAQMLDLENHALAKAWLNISPNASAAIYFNDSDELMVRTRDGRTQHLLYSSYAEQIDRCVVYLDDAHTRGTDIKFPDGFRAAVTLGPKVTKDRLAQGCMRMRRLGQGHSVMFFAPLEVDRHIRALAGKDNESSLDTMDILHWAIRETWENVQRWAPHWVRQGVDHASQYSAWSGFAQGQLGLKELEEKWLQPEAKRLEEHYAPRNASGLDGAVMSPEMRQRCMDLGVQWLSLVNLDEEQEREVLREVTQERQVQRLPPPKVVEPATHSIHEEVVKFIKTGILSVLVNFSDTLSQAFIPAFDTLCGTSAAASEAYIWSQSLLATRDFAKTVENAETMEGYLRPVQWVVSAKSARGDVFVVLSPYEVDRLLPEIRSSKKVHLHIYTPTMIRSMRPCTLALYSIPAIPDGWIQPFSLMDQLIIFAGQLYLRDYESYVRLCRFLCVYTRDLQDVKVEPDGFIRPKNRPQDDPTLTIAHTFAHSPIPSLRALMHLRSGGMEIKSTHMGKILHGKLLSEGDFDE